MRSRSRTSLSLAPYLMEAISAFTYRCNPTRRSRSCPSQTQLVFLVDALVEVLVQEDRESFSPVGRSGDVVGVVSGIRETSSGK